MVDNVLDTDLDFLVHCIYHLKHLRNEALRFGREHPGIRNPRSMAEHDYQKDMVEYFDLPPFAQGWVFFNEIVRLHERPAGQKGWS